MGLVRILVFRVSHLQRQPLSPFPFPFLSFQFPNYSTSRATNTCQKSHHPPNLSKKHLRIPLFLVSSACFYVVLFLVMCLLSELTSTDHEPVKIPPHLATPTLFLNGEPVKIPHTPPEHLDRSKWQSADVDRVVDFVRKVLLNPGQSSVGFDSSSDGFDRSLTGGIFAWGESSSKVFEDDLEVEEFASVERKLEAMLSKPGKSSQAANHHHQKARLTSHVIMPTWFLGWRSNQRLRYSKFDNQDVIGQPLAYYTVPLFLSSGRPRWASEITLVTQCSLSRLDSIMDIARSWDGVISLAVLVQHPLLVPVIPVLLTDFAARLEAANPKVRVDISLLFGYRFSMVEQGSGASEDGVEVHPYDHAYPVNALRNLATDHAMTDFIFNMDCDFLPSADMHSILTSPQLYTFMRLQSKWQMAVFVIPAFEMMTNLTLAVPFTRADLDELCTRLIVIPFHARFSMPEELVDLQQAALWCAGKLKQYHVSTNNIQGPTNYSRWLSAEEPFPVELPRVKLNRYYEPYVLGLKALFPRFDERFRGYSFNKRAHMIEMQYAQFDFYTLPKVFVIHRRHEISSSKRMVSASKVVKETVKRTYEDFITFVKDKYPPAFAAKKLLGSLYLYEFFN